MTAFIVLGSALLLLAGTVLIVLWGGAPVRPPRHDDDPDPSSDGSEGQNKALQRYLWWANLACFAAAVPALLIAWPGGRLVMRVLAMPHPPLPKARRQKLRRLLVFPACTGRWDCCYSVGCRPAS